MFKRFKNLLKNPFIQGGFFLTLSGFFINFVNYIFNVLAAQGLGPNGYGEITAFFSYLIISSIPLSIISTIIIQRIGSAENDLGTTLAIEKWLKSKAKHWWPLVFLLLIFIPFTPRLTNLSLIPAIFLIPLLFLSIVGSFYSAALQGLHLFLALSLISILMVLLKLSGGILAWYKIGGVNTIVIFISISSILSLIITLYIYYWKIRQADKIKIINLNKRIIHIFKSEQLLITSLSIIAINLLSNIDIIFVKKFFLPHEAGIYSSWSLFAKIILYVIGPLVSLSLIFFSNKKNINQQNKVLIISLVCLVIIGFSSYCIYSIFPGFLTRFFFGNKFNDVIPYLTKAAIFGTFYTTILFLNNYFLAKKSRVVLVLPLLIPVYLIGLFIFKTSIQNVMILNIYFTASITLIYLFSFMYNIGKWKQRFLPTS